MRGALVGFLEPVGFAVDVKDFGVMDEAVDQRGDASGGWKDLVPFGEAAVGGDHGALLLVAAADEFEQEIGVAVGIGEVADLIDDEELGACVMAQPAAQSGIAVERGEIAKHLARAGEHDGVALDHGLMGDIPRQGGLAGAVWAAEHGIGGFLEEAQLHQRFDAGAVASFGPVPVEVAQGFEAADMRGFQAALQAAAGAFLFFPSEQPPRPSAGKGFVPIGEQAMQVQCLGFGTQAVAHSSEAPFSAS